MHSGVVLPAVDIGFVFALSRESAGLVDLLSNIKTTIGNGLKYREAQWDRFSLVIVESGPGQERAQLATESLIQTFRPRLLISAGFAGALVPSLVRNQIVVPSRLLNEQGEEMNLDVQRLSVSKSGFTGNDSADFTNQANCEQEMSIPISSLQLDRFASGTLLTVDQVVTQVAKKKELGTQYGATIVDMETWAVASVCRTRCTPFIPVRIVIDPSDEELPAEIRYISKASGSIAELAGALFGAVSRRPSAILDAWRLKENALIATDTLARALTSLLNSIP